MTTVKELISQLDKMPSAAVVYLEGCDCQNKATWVEHMGKLLGLYLPEDEEKAEDTVLIGADVYSSVVKLPTHCNLPNYHRTGCNCGRKKEIDL